MKHAYLQCYGLAVNDIFVSANSRNETIHLTETIISADLLILLKTKDCVRERTQHSSACRVQAARLTFHAAYRRFIRRKNISLSRDTFAMIWTFTHARGHRILLLLMRNYNQHLRRERAGEQNIQKTRK